MNRFAFSLSQISSLFGESIRLFKECCPSLFYGLVLLLGTLFILETPFALIPFLLILRKKELFTSCVLFLLPSVLLYQLYTFPFKAGEVEGIFLIHSIRKNERFGQGWCYQGALKTKQGRIPCSCFNKNFMTSSQAYKIKGRVVPLSPQLGNRSAWFLPKHYRLKIEGPWEKQTARLTLVDLRYRAQEGVKRYILRNISQPRAAHFLSGILTGQLEDRVMQKEFTQLGLSHLMAISGLHFSLIGLALHLLLRFFLPAKYGTLFLIFGLTLYFLFIGPTPSVLRAWLMAMIFLVGQLLEKKSSALNALGTAIVISLLLDPLSIRTLSFQLSYLATAGILFFYSFADSIIQKWIPKKRLSEMVDLSWIGQLIYILSALFREGLALTLSVHITLMPFLLFTFHQFPLSSFFYNLFFPFLATLAIFLFLFSLILGSWMHWINGHYCDWILQITESPPIIWKTISIQSMPSWILTALMTGILFLAITMKVKKRCWSSQDIE